MGKILLYYKYVHIEYPKRILKWQQQICQNLDLHGRIIIAHEGINGTVGGSDEHIERYKEIMQRNSLFADVDFKDSPGGKDSFPRLRIVVKDEIVHLGVDTTACTVADGGVHLTPEQAHALLLERPDDLIILDARNTYEWRVGTFEGAITPPIRHFREFPQYVDEHVEEYRNKRVLMFCTGGVRCERASAYLKLKDIAKEVYQIEGGIHRYVERYPNGFFRGKNYVFDNRIAVRVNDDVCAQCDLCSKPCDDYRNCINASCNSHFICCPSCVKEYERTCSVSCRDLVRAGKVKLRPEYAVCEQGAIRHIGT